MVRRWLTAFVAFAFVLMSVPIGALEAKAASATLFFSEYVEGSSFNKALEIYNGTGAAIDLSTISVRLYSNGAAAASATITLSGTLANGDVVVLAHPSASAQILALADVLSMSVVNFNGDDAVELVANGITLDVIGQVGFDPGTAWGTAPTRTQDQTLRRKASVLAGDTNGSDAFDPSLEWDGFAIDTFDGLGSHLDTPPPGDVAPSVTATTPANGASAVALNADISITFSEDVNATSGAFVITCVSSGAHTFALSGGPRTFSLDPAADFSSSESCSVTVRASEVTDQDANDPPDTMAADFSWSFLIVAADVGPSLTSHAPASGATNVPISADISVGFSEPVSLTDSWFEIVCEQSGTRAASQSGGPQTFILDPGDFALNETCTVTVRAAQVHDQDSNDPPDTLASDVTWSFTTAATSSVPTLFFSEYVEGSSFNKALEIYNGTGAAVDLAAGGYSVRLYSNGAATPGNSINLTGTLANGDVLVLAHASATFVLLADVVSSAVVNFNGDDAVELVANGITLDVIGQVGFDPGTAWGTAPTRTQDQTLRRKASVLAGDTNGSDAFDPSLEWDGFAIDTFDGLGSHLDTPPPGDVAPSVTATTPANGASAVALNADISITFSEDVNATSGAFVITCVSSGAHTFALSGGPRTFSLDPAADFSSSESCSVTVRASEVTDQDANDPPDTMAADFFVTFETAAATFTCGDPATFIHQVQGIGAATPIPGTSVTIEGVVVGDYQQAGGFGGFYVQEENSDADADALTSEGIFVFNTSFEVNAGDLVRLRGTATEFSGLTQIASVSALSICPSGGTASPSAVSLPVASVADLERFEGMLVNFAQTLTATEVFNLGRFGEVSLSGAGRLYTPTASATPGAAAIAQLDQNNRSRIILDDGNNLQNIDPTRYPQGGLSADNTLRVGDTLSSLTGVMDYRFSNYRIQPIGSITWSHTNPRTPEPATVGGNLKIASFNVLNFFNGDGLGGGFPTSRGANTQFELQRQLAKEVNALAAINADIVGLMEIENDGGANSALAQLVSALNSALGAGTYSYIDTGVIGTDEIKVALIYKATAVTPVGAFKVITSAIDPAFIDTLNRPSLAQTFRQSATGQQLTVVVNHLKSKGSACSADPDTGDGQGNCNLTRTAAAAALARWLGTDPTGSGDPDFLIIGDLNSYTFENPITALTTSGFVNLVREFGGLTPYSYVFNGESGYLDHALATASLASQVTGVTDWHINPDEPTVLDYNVEFKTASQVNTFYAPGPYRSSDHDPVIIGVHLNSAPTANANGPYTVGEGASVILTASATDADADSLSYAWDLDNNGTFETAGQSVTFSAAAIDGPATRTVKVRVSDAEDTAVATTTVNVINVAPTATAGGPYAGVPFAPVTFSGNATDPAGAADILTYAWDFDYNGAFTADASGVNLKNPSHAYAAPGNYRVALRVTDEDGGVSTLAIANVSIGVPLSTTGKIEGTPKWGDVLKTKINVRANANDITGRVIIEGDGWTYESTRLDSIVVTAVDATVFGAFGSVTFRLDVHDGGNTGTDTLRVQTSDGYDSGLLMEPRGQLTVFAN
jgi:predicted extracellular nuclease